MTAGEVLTLGLYLVQQLGVMLGVGAAIITLIAHLVSTRDGVIEEAEARFARAIERVLMIGLFLMISSGVFITALHSTAGEAVIIFTPAFVFKWLLIGVVTLPLIVGHKHPFPPLWFEGFVGGTWLALFILHVVAPIATWTALILLYAIWLVVFFILWTVLAKVLHAHDPTSYKTQQSPSLAPAGGPGFSSMRASTVSLPMPNLKPLISSIFAAPPKQPAVQVPPQPAPTPAPVPPVAPPMPEVPPVPAPVKPPMPTPPVAKAVVPPPPKPVAAVVPAKPAAAVLPVKMPQKPEEKFTDPDSLIDLPAIRVMPRTVEDIEKQNRASVVEFN